MGERRGREEGVRGGGRRDGERGEIKGGREERERERGEGERRRERGTLSKSAKNVYVQIQSVRTSRMCTYKYNV